MVTPYIKRSAQTDLTMALRSFYLKTFLLAISLLSTTVTAQDSPNNTNLSGCSEQSLQKDWPVNATGSANVSNIYLSTTFGDYRNDTNNDSTSRRFRPITMAYLTVPLESHGKACVYLYQGVDNRGRGGGPNGCDDVLAQACVDVLERKLRLPDDMPPAGMVCPSGAHDDELDKACGDDTVLRGVFSSASTIDLGNSSQSCSNIPKGIDLNSGDYTTREIFGWGPQDYDTDPQNFTWYDEYVTRPVPMVLSTNIDGKAEAKVVCIAMNRLNNDSRVPPDSINNGKDNESAAVSMQWKSKAGMAILMVGVPIISFVLA